MKIKLIIALVLFSCGQQNIVKVQIEPDIKTVCDSSTFDLTSYNPMLNQHTLKEEDTFFILKSIDLDSGEWKVVVDFTNFKNFKNDSILESEFGFSTGGYYLLNNLEVIKKMKREWKVKFINKDCCTPNINMDFFQNNKLVLSLGIVINKKREGFQTSEYGWTPTTKKDIVAKYYKYFEFCDSLIINR